MECVRFRFSTELRKLAKDKPTKAGVPVIAMMARRYLLGVDSARAIRAELFKLERGKKACASASFLARLTLEALREAEKDKATDELERMYLLPDPRA